MKKVMAFLCTFALICCMGIPSVLAEPAPPSLADSLGDTANWTFTGDSNPTGAAIVNEDGALHFQVADSATGHFILKYAQPVDTRSMKFKFGIQNWGSQANSRFMILFAGNSNDMLFYDGAGDHAFYMIKFEKEYNAVSLFKKASGGAPALLTHSEQFHTNIQNPLEAGKEYVMEIKMTPIEGGVRVEVLADDAVILNYDDTTDALAVTEGYFQMQTENGQDVDVTAAQVETEAPVVPADTTMEEALKDEANWSMRELNVDTSTYEIMPITKEDDAYVAKSTNKSFMMGYANPIDNNMSFDLRLDNISTWVTLVFSASKPFTEVWGDNSCYCLCIDNDAIQINYKGARFDEEAVIPNDYFKNGKTVRVDISTETVGTDTKITVKLNGDAVLTAVDKLQIVPAGTDKGYFYLHSLEANSFCETGIYVSPASEVPPEVTPAPNPGTDTDVDDGNEEEGGSPAPNPGTDTDVDDGNGEQGGSSGSGSDTDTDTEGGDEPEGGSPGTGYALPYAAMAVVLPAVMAAAVSMKKAKSNRV